MGFKLFGKKESSPEERVRTCLGKRDWAGLAKAYYELGRAAMEQGGGNRAWLWLHRADTIYSARDEVYDKVGEALTEDCAGRIGDLEEDPALLYNAASAGVEEQAEELGDPQVRVWGLLSMARLVKLGERLSALPGCEALGRLGWAVDVILRSMQEGVTQEEYQGLMDLCNALYELGDSEAFFGGGEIPVSGGAPLQVFDLNGSSVLLELNGYIDNHLRLLAALSQGKEPPAAECSLAACTLLLDYFVRTRDGRPEDVPQIRQELARIRSDGEFAASDLTWEEVRCRVEEYTQLELPG